MALGPRFQGLVETMETRRQDSSPPPVSGEPFRPEAPKGSGDGCGRIGLIGCGVATLLLGAAAIVFLLKADDLFVWAMENFRTEILESLPRDLEEEQAVRLREGFEGAVAAVESGAVDQQALQQLQQALSKSILRSEDKLTKEQVAALIEALEGVAAAKRVPDESEAALPDQP